LPVFGAATAGEIEPMTAAAVMLIAASAITFMFASFA
jgi:hypothetical protein